MMKLLSTSGGWLGQYLIAFGKAAGHRGVAPREFDVHSRWKPAREQKRKEGEEEEESDEEEEE